MNTEIYTLKSEQILKKAARIAKEKNHKTAEAVHLLKAILIEEPHASLYVFEQFKVDINQLTSSLDQALDAYPRTIEETKVFLGKEASNVLNKAKFYSETFSDEYVTVEMILLGLVTTKSVVSAILIQFGCNEQSFKEVIIKLRGKRNPNKEKNAEAGYRSLERFGKNLNEMVSEGKIDPVIGRDEEIRRVLQILSRRTKNNPMLIGEPGVGKTALVEGLAQRIVAGDVPENLLTKKIISLDMGLMVAGAKMKGEFEERLKGVVQDVVESNGEIVLFIDEIHTLIGNGDTAMDAANLLKPALARGEMHTVGATTLKEYQKYIEKDKALERRFQTIMVEEPSFEDTVSILRGIKLKYENHHAVRIQDEAIIAAVGLSSRYISDRFLPDKAIDLIDEAAAKLRLEMNSVPQELDEIHRKIIQLEIEKEAIKRENNFERNKILSENIASLKETKAELASKWEVDKKHIQTVKENKLLLEQLRNEAELAEKQGEFARVAELRYALIPEKEETLQKLNSEYGPNSFISEEVNADDIAEVVAKWTGIPLSKMLQSEREKLIYLEDELRKKVVGQEEAIEAISDAIRRSRAGMHDPNKPIGSFLFLGTTGVGKTELAKALADYLFNDENALIRIDMSEFQEPQSISRLIGSPPGYVGYDESGQLTEAVRRHAHSVVLLDEIEKAHPDVWNTMLQVLDDGRLTDNKGRMVNFKNTIIIMTSNIGSHLIQERLSDIDELDEDDEEMLDKLKEDLIFTLRKTIRPEFLNRIDEIVMFRPLTYKNIRSIVDIQFHQVQKRLNEQGISLSVTDKALDKLGNEGFDQNFGARPLKRAIQRLVLNELSKQILMGKIQKNSSIIMDADERIFFKNYEGSLL